MGQSRRFGALPAASGLPQSTDIERLVRLVRFVQDEDIRYSPLKSANFKIGHHLAISDFCNAPKRSGREIGWFGNRPWLSRTSVRRFKETLAAGQATRSN